MFWPLIESYWVLAFALFSLQPNVVSKRRLFLQRAQWIAEKLHTEHKIYFYECCSMEVLANALSLFEDWGIVSIKEEVVKTQRGRVVEKKSVDELVSLLPPYQQENQLQQFVESINKFRKQPALPTTGKSMKKALMHDFPVLAKL